MVLAGLVAGVAVFAAFLLAGSDLPPWAFLLVALAGVIAVLGIVRVLPRPEGSLAWGSEVVLAAAAAVPLGGVVAYRFLERWFERCWSLPCGFWDAAFAVGVPLGVFLATAALVFWTMRNRNGAPGRRG